jgi:acetyl-CoA C-acetyltransferase
LEGEIVPLTTEIFTLNGYNPRGIHLAREAGVLAKDTHVRPSPVSALARLRPVFGGVQTGGNSSGVVDGAAAALVGSGPAVRAHGRAPLARVVATATVGVPPEAMGIGPAPAIRALLDATGLGLGDIDRFEINEAFGAQIVAVERELGLDRSRLNVNGGAIAIGHPLAATGIRLAVTLARELRRSRLRYGIASACIGGGQGIATLIERPSPVEQER